MGRELAAVGPFDVTGEEVMIVLALAQETVDQRIVCVKMHLKK